jgi:hypothetical protein
MLYFLQSAIGKEVSVMTAPNSFSAFTPTQCLITGSLEEAALAAFYHLDAQSCESVLIFNDQTCAIVDVDLSGDAQQVQRKAASYPMPSNSRISGPVMSKPDLIGMEVSLLPRHWEWLSKQEGSASVTLRKLIDSARKDPKINARSERRQAQNLTYKFCHAIAGDLPDYEEALRCLFAVDEQGFDKHLASWPADIARRAKSLAKTSWQSD